MSGNPLPWIVIAAVVVVSLAMKGYLKFPLNRPAVSAPLSADQPNRTPGFVGSVSPNAPNVDELVAMGSYVLGIAFAKAKRLEAENDLASRIAQEAGESIHAAFTAPFSKPEPAGPSSPANPPGA